MPDLPHDRILKTAPGPFRSIWRRQKRAEFRKNDWDAQVGDRVLLMEHNGEQWIWPYRRILIEITHKQEGFGIPVGYAMLSFVEIRRAIGKRGHHASHKTCTGC